MSDTILVTGASGQLGQRVLHHLLEKVPAGRVIAASRDPSKLAAFASRGVATRKVDFDDAASLPTAFAGVDTLLIVSTDALGEPGRRIAQHKAAVAAAVAAGVKRIAYTSMPKPEPGNPVLFAGDHYATEQAIKASGIPYTIFRNSWYQENLLMALPNAIASGKWYSAAGEGRLAHIGRDDVARAIAAALASGTGRNVTYTLTGAKALTTEEIAALAREVTGKPLEVVHVSDEALLAGLEAAGVPQAYAPLLVSFDVNMRIGGLSEVTTDVATLSGTEPRPLEAFLEENKAALLGA
ncbi:SDR family oxidoreductase [Nitratireductor sp. ZSWI3]|uniref:SDR family oxidoreductase n=1 Tax=Nitratireductor sp. ZSWI3 TaxID=2966359 RepID=UPI00214FFA57|nr:SDR family oxidoreductase [Nitratireductor sp. ZSWI3]MCR4267145.1 SDR family oxidoreductase [Nitratireductor sp. ZSWI3]